MARPHREMTTRLKWAFVVIGLVVGCVLALLVGRH